MRIRSLTVAALTAAALTAASAFGAIDGSVVNDTSGKPQSGVEVSLIHPGPGGMQTLGSATTNAQGQFKIDQEIPSPPALLQATYQGVTYNLFLQPGAPATGLRFPVYDTTSDASAAKLAQHMMMIEPGDDVLKITEVLQVENGGKVTFQDPNKGSIQFYLPKYAQKNANVSVEGPGGMPINRQPEKTTATDIFKVGYPVKPGQTTYEVTYSVPATTKFAGRVLGDAPLRLVTGQNVTLTGGDNLKAIGQEPRLKAHIYEVSGKPGAAFELNIEGTGSIRTEGAESQQPQEDTGEPQPKAGPARIYSQLPWVLGLTFAILAIGGVLLYRRGTA